MFKIAKTSEYVDWQQSLSFKQRILVDARIERIRASGALGFMRHIQGPLIELKWKQGLRIYIARTGEQEITLLLGGTKHGQSRDIKKAKTYLGL